jgi:threonine dehydrogenase-like Zn-dependent dehydrogenase
LKNVDVPSMPADGWLRFRPRLAGICGSDLATIDGTASRYFEPLVSFPFVPGHEVVGRLEDGTRVVLEPVLGAEARGFPPPFPGAAPGDSDDYGHLVAPPLEPGIQVGYCASTGGGWSTQFVAHRTQLHPVPDTMSDETAVIVEPAAVGVHAALRADVGPGATVAVIGAGNMGLLAVAALAHLQPEVRIIVGA